MQLMSALVLFFLDFFYVSLKIVSPLLLLLYFGPVNLTSILLLLVILGKYNINITNKTLQYKFRKQISDTSNVNFVQEYMPLTIGEHIHVTMTLLTRCLIPPNIPFPLDVFPLDVGKYRFHCILKCIF